MGRKRPSGDGNKSRRFAQVTQPDGSKLKVPVVKDVGTFLFLADEHGQWGSRPIATLLDSAAELTEGKLFEIEGAAPGHGMGQIIGAKVVQVKLRIAVDRSGKYSKFGQIKRLVYAVEVPNYDQLAAVEAAEDSENTKALTETDIDRLVDDWSKENP